MIFEGASLNIYANFTHLEKTVNTSLVHFNFQNELVNIQNVPKRIVPSVSLGFELGGIEILNFSGWSSAYF